MNILTIDMDFISGNYLEKDLAKVVGDKITANYWDKVLDASGTLRVELEDNKHNVRAIFKIIMGCLKSGSSNIVFGAFHDAILNHIDTEGEEELYIYNFDHHHDISYCNLHSTPAAKGECSESNWLMPLAHRGKVVEYHWVLNETSELYCGADLPFQFTYYNGVQNAPDLTNKKWDLVYVALSPNYTADIHWFYYFMLIDLYEGYTGKEAHIDDTRYTKILTEFN